jgi:hypothetical protein
MALFKRGHADVGYPERWRAMDKDRFQHEPALKSDRSTTTTSIIFLGPDTCRSSASATG